MRQESSVLLRAAASLTAIHTAGEYNQAVALGRTLQVMSQQVEELYKPIKQEFDLQKGKLLAMEREDLQPILANRDQMGKLLKEHEDAEKREAERRDALERSLAANNADASMPLPAPVIVQETVPQKVKGKVKRTLWRARVDNLALLVAAVAKGEVSIQALQPNQSYLNKRADSDWEAMNFPGVTSYEETTVHFRA